MKGRVIVLDTWGERQAAALVVDGVLQDLAIDPADDAPLPGAIYRGTVDRPVKGQGGVFLRLPGAIGLSAAGLWPVTGPIGAGPDHWYRRARQGAACHHAASFQKPLCHRNPRCARPEYQPPHPR